MQSVVKEATHRCGIRWEAYDTKYGPKMASSWGLAANCPPHLSSDVGHELANKSETFSLCWYIDANNVVRCSLRSNGDCDVGAVAKAFGGGGHKNASGFSTDVGTLMGWLR